MGGFDVGLFVTVVVSCLVGGLLAGIGFIVPIYMGARLWIMNLLATPQINAFAKAAAKFSGAGGDWKSVAAGGLFKVAGKLIDRWGGD